MEKIIKVGVGIYIFNDKNELLLGLRKSKHGEGTWSPPGGHLEFGEELKAAAARETLEETSLEIDIEDIEIIGITNDFFTENQKHYVTIHTTSCKYSGEIKITEPDKWEKWQWFSLQNLPKNLFMPAKKFLKEKSFKTKVFT